MGKNENRRRIQFQNCQSKAYKPGENEIGGKGEKVFRQQNQYRIIFRFLYGSAPEGADIQNGKYRRNLQKKSNYTSLISSAESLKKHADKLLDTKEEESLFTEEKKEQAVKEIKGFVEDYNRMVERLQRVGTTVSSLYLKQLQGHVADNKDLLRELGITQNTTGTLKINEDKLKEADPEKLKKLFGTDGGFGDKISSWAEKIQANAEANLAGYYGNENLYGNNYNRYGTNISGYGGGFNTRG